MKRCTVLTLTLALLLAGCGGQPLPTQTDSQAGQPQPIQGAVSPKTEDISDLFSHRDYETAYEKHAKITLKGSTAACDSDAVRIQGSTVTVTDGGTYVLSGTLTDGQIIVEAQKEDKTQLVLDGVQITSTDAAPIYIKQADKVFVTLAAGSENTLQGGECFTADGDTNIDSVIFSKEDLTLNGSGSLSVSSPAGHGIVSKDGLTFTGGSYDITCAAHGIAGKDSVCIDGGSFTVVAGKDGIHAENNDDAALGYALIKTGSFQITAEGDGVASASWMQLDGGTYHIVTGGGSENGTKQTSENWGGFGGGKGGMPGGVGGRPGGRSAVEGAAFVTAETAEDSISIKGIKAGGEMIITGGSYIIDSADDAVHSNGSITVNGGSFQIATGDDGFHADDTLTVNAGTVAVSESYEGLEGLHILIAGGQLELTAADDGLNAAGGTDGSGMGGRDQFGGMGFGDRGGMSAGNGSVEITGGTLAVQASGDGIDANGYLKITGGYTTVCGPTQGDTATLDYDTTATITGGVFIGSGGAGMAQSFSDPEQGAIAVRASAQAGSNEIRLTDQAGRELLRHMPALGYNVVILSSPDIVRGQTYILYAGAASGEITAQ